MQANSGTAGGRASPSSSALVPLFLWLSLRLSNARVITCKVAQGRNRLINHRFTKAEPASGA